MDKKRGQNSIINAGRIAAGIFVIRNQNVMMDSDPADKQVKRTGFK